MVQAEITETFTLTSGDLASEEQRREDIVVYREPAAEVSATTDVVDRTCSGETGRLERVLAG